MWRLVWFVLAPNPRLIFLWLLLCTTIPHLNRVWYSRCGWFLSSHGRHHRFIVFIWRVDYYVGSWAVWCICGICRWDRWIWYWRGGILLPFDFYQDIRRGWRRVSYWFAWCVRFVLRMSLFFRWWLLFQDKSFYIFKTRLWSAFIRVLFEIEETSFYRLPL